MMTVYKVALSLVLLYVPIAQGTQRMEEGIKYVSEDSIRTFKSVLNNHLYGVIEFKPKDYPTKPVLRINSQDKNTFLIVLYSRKTQYILKNSPLHNTLADTTLLPFNQYEVRFYKPEAYPRFHSSDAYIRKDYLNHIHANREGTAKLLAYMFNNRLYNEEDRLDFMRRFSGSHWSLNINSSALVSTD